MAKFVPSLDVILSNNKEDFEEGELHLFNCLNLLDDSYEVYYKPYINGEQPDIVVVRKNYGILIIEICNVNFDEFEFDYEKNLLEFKDENYPKYATPFYKVNSYAQKIIELHSSKLAEKKLLGKKVDKIVNALVYFSKCNNSVDVSKKFKNNKYNISKMGTDIPFAWFTNTCQCFKKENEDFTDEIYNEMIELMTSSFFYKIGKKVISLDKDQEEIVESEPNVKKKILGTSGSGKTTILAMRAIKAQKRTKGKVLILTFNIMLRSYIEDKISGFVSENEKTMYVKSNFHIIHYHEFIRQSLIKAQIPVTSELNPQILYSDNVNEINAAIKIFKQYDDKIEKYDTILIDEIQDFEYSWMKVILNCFLKKDGEYILFGDENQNIYGRELDEKDKKIKTNVSGSWKRLKKSHRNEGKITYLAEKFKNEYLNEKYGEGKKDSIIIENPIKDAITNHKIEYFYNPYIEVEKVPDIVMDFCETNRIQFGDVCILTRSHEEARTIEYQMRINYGIQSETISESEEVYQKLKEIRKDGNLRDKLENYRRTLKFNFKLNNNRMKLCTIHSFKGWEAPSVFLIINDEKINYELIYTGITRASKNLVIINIAKDSECLSKSNLDSLNDFFVKNIEEKHLFSKMKNTKGLVKINDNNKIINDELKKSVIHITDEELENQFDDEAYECEREINAWLDWNDGEIDDDELEIRLGYFD